MFEQSILVNQLVKFIKKNNVKGSSAVQIKYYSTIGYIKISEKIWSEVIYSPIASMI